MTTIVSSNSRAQSLALTNECLLAGDDEAAVLSIRAQLHAAVDSRLIPAL